MASRSPVRRDGAVDGRVRDLLLDRPVQVPRARARDDLAVQLDLELDVIDVRLGAQVVERLGLLRLPGDPVGLEIVERRHPGADRGRERLPQERAERLVLPGLDVASAPVVDEDDAEDVLERAVDRDGLARRARSPDHESELELDVEAPARAEDGCLGIRRLRLARRPPDRRSADDDRPRAAVVRDRELPPVGQERLRSGAEQLAEVGRVLERGVEVDVVGDLEREVHLDVRQRHRLAFLDTRDASPPTPPGPRP